MKVKEIHSEALALPEDQRAGLIADLICSMPSVLSDVDDGSYEASRRLAEMRNDPSPRRTWSKIKNELER